MCTGTAARFRSEVRSHELPEHQGFLSPARDNGSVWRAESSVDLCVEQDGNND